MAGPGSCRHTTFPTASDVAAQCSGRAASGPHARKRVLPATTPHLPTPQVLAPLLHPAALATDMRVSLLLHGPAGSGRRTAVRAAAAALGLHCITASCHDLQSAPGQDSSKGVLASLQALVDDAARFAPCVLLLQVGVSLKGDCVWEEGRCWRWGLPDLRMGRQGQGAAAAWRVASTHHAAALIITTDVPAVAGLPGWLACWPQGIEALVGTRGSADASLPSQAAATAKVAEVLQAATDRGGRAEARAAVAAPGCVSVVRSACAPNACS